MKARQFHTDKYSIDNPHMVLAQIQDKPDGAMGLTMLVLGFGTQAIGAVLSAAGHGGATGTSAALAALAGALLTFAVACGVYLLLRPRVISPIIDSSFPKDEFSRVGPAVRTLHEDPDEYFGGPIVEHR